MLAFGDDHSVGADVAWRWVTAQEWDGWGVDVVTVTAAGPDMDSWLSHPPLHEYASESPRVPAEGSGIGPVRHLTTAFDPRQVLCQLTGADLTVIGARGRGILKAMHLGSTAEWLLCCPTTPLVIARAPDPVRTVVACVDGSGHARAMVNALIGLPWIRGRHVAVLGVAEAGEDIVDEVNTAAEALGIAGADVETSVIDPNPRAVFVNARYVLMAEVDHRRPDLVALGTKGLTGMRRITVGSVASTIAHHADCSVLLARDVNLD